VGQELLEYDVLRFVGQPPGWVPFTPAEIDCGAVPTGQTWRADRITVGVFTGVTNSEPPDVLLYDQAPVGPTSIPVDASNLSVYPGFNPGGAMISSWLDIDDTSAPITIPAGNQLAIVFQPLEFGASAIFMVRVQFSKYQGDAGKPQPFAGGTPGPSIPAAL
jgi:hypothetical protein